MRYIPPSNNRGDLPRLTANTVKQIINNVKVLQNSQASATRTLEQVLFTPIAQPSSPVAGQTYFDSTSNKLRTYDGTSWQDHW